MNNNHLYNVISAGAIVALLTLYVAGIIVYYADGKLFRAAIMFDEISPWSAHLLAVVREHNKSPTGLWFMLFWNSVLFLVWLSIVSISFFREIAFTTKYSVSVGAKKSLGLFVVSVGAIFCVVAMPGFMIVPNGAVEFRPWAFLFPSVFDPGTVIALKQILVVSVYSWAFLFTAKAVINYIKVVVAQAILPRDRDQTG